MKQTHLDTARLLAIRDGDTADLRALEHLVSCAKCQQAFDDTRWLLLLASLRRRVEGGGHPDPDALFAYRSGALSPQRLEQVGRHLESCERCLALYRRGRLMDSAVAYASPSPKAVARARRGFRPKLRQLGTVLVRRLGDRLAVFVVPEPDLAGFRLGQLRIAEMRAEPEGSKGRPASARGRARRLQSRTEEPAPDEIMGFDLPGGMAQLGAGEYSLLFEPGAPDAEARLTLTVSSADSGEPAEGVRVESAGGEAAPGDLRTDPRGRATLRLSPGLVEITVHVAPPVRFSLEFPD